MMQAEDHDAYPGGRIFADSLAVTFATRLFAAQTRKPATVQVDGRSLPAWRLRHVIDNVDIWIATLRFRYWLMIGMSTL